MGLYHDYTLHNYHHTLYIIINTPILLSAIMLAGTRITKPLELTPARMLVEMEQLPDSAPVTEAYAAVFLGVVRGTMANQRSEFTGPPFIRTGNRHIRYLMGDLRKYRADRRKQTA
jgi:hypothetical protein